MSVKKIKENKSSVSSAIIKAIITSLIGCIVMIALFFLFSVLILSKDLKGGLFTALSFACIFLSALITGFITAKRIRYSGLLYGLISGLPICFLLMILTLSLGGTLGTYYIYAVVTALISSSAGGVIAVNLKKKIKY